MNSTLLIVTLAVGAPALKDAPGAEASIVGEWVVESTTYAGRTRPYAGSQLRYVFTADGKWKIFRGEDQDGENQGYRTDSKATPWRIDLRSDATRTDVAPLHGIYKVEGDTLTLCYGREASAARPTAFAAPRGSDVIMYVLKQVKKD